MYLQSNNNSSNLLFLVIILVGVIIAVTRSIINRVELQRVSQNEDLSDSDTSLIVTMYSSGVTLQKVSEGNLNNHPFVILMTSKITLPAKVPQSDLDSANDEPSDVDSIIDDALGSNFDHQSYDGMGMPMMDLRNPMSLVPAGQVPTPEGQVLMKVTLPVASTVHIVGFSTQDTVFSRLLGNTSIDNILTKASLEGDFPDYFKLYCDKDKEVELREVLDPTRMQFLVDFCTKMNWELIEDNLYFVQSALSKSQDNNTVVSAAESFVNNILPTLYVWLQKSKNPPQILLLIRLNNKILIRYCFSLFANSSRLL